MSLRTTMATLVLVATSSPTSQEFLAKNGFEEEEKEEEGGEEKMEGFVCRSKGFIPVNLPNLKGEFFEVEGIKGRRSKVVGLKEKLAGGFSRGITVGFSTHLIRLRFWLVLLIGNLHPKE